MADETSNQPMACSPAGHAVFTVDQLRTLNADMRAHLEYEAGRRGVDIATVYQEELAAKAELATTTPPNAELLRIADRSPAPQAWYDE